MPRAYYIFQSGRLRRKGNTLYLEGDHPSAASSEQAVPEDATACELATPRTTNEHTGASQTAVEKPNAQGSPVDQPGEFGGDFELSAHDLPIETSHASSDCSSVGHTFRRIIPVEDVAELFIFGTITLNTKLLNFLAHRGIPVHVFNHYGFYSGSYQPRQSNVSGHLLVRQVEHYLDSHKRLVLAREFARGAYHQLHRNLLYYRNRGRNLQEVLETLERQLVAINSADSIPALMGAEGRIREAYYRALNHILALQTPLLRRVKRPPDNLVNALISFGNSLLYSAILSQIYRTPLNPTISYLHEPGTRRFSLALDLAEIFKPMIVDKMMFTLINRQMLSEQDFLPDVGLAVLRESARKLVVQEFERRLQMTVKHRILRRHVSYRGFIRLECYKLVRHLLAMEPYQALRAWW